MQMVWVRVSAVMAPLLLTLHAVQSIGQVPCSRQSMAALQPALPWGYLTMCMKVLRFACVP